MECNKTLKEAENDVIDSFSMYDEWLDKYEYLIDLAGTWNHIPSLQRLMISS